MSEDNTPILTRTSGTVLLAGHFARNELAAILRAVADQLAHVVNVVSGKLSAIEEILGRQASEEVGDAPDAAVRSVVVERVELLGHVVLHRAHLAQKVHLVYRGQRRHLDDHLAKMVH